MWRLNEIACCAFLSLMVAACGSVPSRSQRKSSAAGRFIVEDGTIDGHGGSIPTKQLVDTVSQQSVWVLPTQGGRVEAVRLMSPNSHRVRDVILTHNGDPAAIKENALFKGAILLPFANRIANGTYTFMGRTHRLHINEPSRGNAIHGLLYNKELSVVYSAGGDQYAIVTLEYKFDGTDPGYPFPLSVLLTYILTENSFVLNIRATNEDDARPLPFYMGWHPYIKVTKTADAVVEFQQCSNYSHVLTDPESLIPTGETEPTKLFTNGHTIGGSTSAPTYIDDGFAILAAFDSKSNCTATTTTIYDTVAKEAVFLFQDREFRFVQAFTGSASISGEQAVAIEPMSAETDAYNNFIGLTILNAKQKWSSSFGITLGNPEHALRYPVPFP
ncbi:uncharacterized protein YihR-like [Sycon ciliatum]|uniref:uncharacterized protein YihR-like n=1 Tax=Sycon ciliatum TaxID=27933 RepID=UPI0020AC94C5